MSITVIPTRLTLYERRSGRQVAAVRFQYSGCPTYASAGGDDRLYPNIKELVEWTASTVQGQSVASR